MVVAIIGILAAVAIPSFSSYVRKARMAEATTFLGEIKQRQEAYRSEFGQYVATGWNPAAVPGEDPVAWPTTVTAWQQLAARPDSEVYFRYRVFAGAPGSEPPTDDHGYTGNDFWFVSQAEGDLDGDGTVVLVEGYSAASHLYIDQSAGWE